jgi:hypothetical protein
LDDRDDRTNQSYTGRPPGMLCQAEFRKGCCSLPTCPFAHRLTQEEKVELQRFRGELEEGGREPRGAIRPVPSASPTRSSSRAVADGQSGSLTLTAPPGDGDLDSDSDEEQNVVLMPQRPTSPWRKFAR